MACDCIDECTCSLVGGTGVTVVGDGSAGTPFTITVDATATESAWTGSSLNAAIDVVAGGVNGHAPTLELVLDPASTGASITGSGLLVSASNPAVVASLPVAPVDGQEVYLQDANMASLGIMWRFRYNAASANPEKWEFVGGAGAYSEVRTSETSSGGAAWEDLATVGPSFAPLPASGIYVARMSATQRRVPGTGAGVIGSRIGVSVGGVDPTVDDHLLSNLSDQGSPDADNWEQAGGFVNITGVTGDTVKLMYQTTGGADVDYSRRTLELSPVRMSG